MSKLEVCNYASGAWDEQTPFFKKHPTKEKIEFEEGKRYKFGTVIRIAEEIDTDKKTIKFKNPDGTFLKVAYSDDGKIKQITKLDKGGRSIAVSVYHTEGDAAGHISAQNSGRTAHGFSKQLIYSDTAPYDLKQQIEFTEDEKHVFENYDPIKKMWSQVSVRDKASDKLKRKLEEPVLKPDKTGYVFLQETVYDSTGKKTEVINRTNTGENKTRTTYASDGKETGRFVWKEDKWIGGLIAWLESMGVSLGTPQAAEAISGKTTAPDSIGIGRKNVLPSSSPDIVKKERSPR